MSRQPYDGAKLMSVAIGTVWPPRGSCCSLPLTPRALLYLQALRLYATLAPVRVPRGLAKAPPRGAGPSCSCQGMGHARLEVTVGTRKGR